MELTTVTESNLAQIQEWISSDPWHKNDARHSAAYMLSGNGGLLSYCVQDDKGPVFYIRLNKDNDLVRVIAQFAPEDVVSKRRVILGLTRAFLPASKKFAKDRGYKGLIFESINPKLIAFMDKLDFKPAGNNDYVLRFEVEHV